MHCQVSSTVNHLTEGGSAELVSAFKAGICFVVPVVAIPGWNLLCCSCGYHSRLESALLFLWLPFQAKTLMGLE
jgi:hypothetical protein